MKKKLIIIFVLFSCYNLYVLARSMAENQSNDIKNLILKMENWIWKLSQDMVF